MRRLLSLSAILFAAILLPQFLFGQMPVHDPVPMPRNLSAVFHDHAVSLRWNAPESPKPPTSYKIFRNVGFTMPALLATITDTAYDDTTIVLNTFYHYGVVAMYDTVHSMPAIVSVFTGTGGEHDSGYVKIWFTSKPPRIGYVNHVYSYDAEVSTLPAGVAVCFKLDEGPEGMTIDSATGVITWTPTRAGCYEVEIKARACDSLRGSSRQEFAIFVLSGIPGSVAGNVRNASGEGLRDVRVRLFDVARGEFVMRTQTNDSGHYSFAFVNPSTYYVRAKPENHRYLPQWYDGKERIEDATPVVVAESAHVNADFVLKLRDNVHERYHVQGTVSDSGSTPLRNAKVVATRLAHDIHSNEMYDDHDEEYCRPAWAVTDSNGHYDMILRSGTYIFGAFKEHYRPQYWNHQISPLDADRLVLDRDTSGIDFNLQPIRPNTGSISGVIRNSADSTPVESHVMAFLKDSTGHCRGYVTATHTDTSGAYTLRHLPSGNYIVLAKDDDDFIPTFYTPSGGTPYLDSATAVTVSGGPVTGIDIYVAPDSVDGLNNIAGSIAISAPSGSANSQGAIPAGGVIVTISDKMHGAVGSGVSGSDGSYVVAGLAPGTYSVTFQKPGLSSAVAQVSLGYQNNAPTTTTVNAQLSGDGRSPIGTMSIRPQWNLVSLPVDVVEAHRSQLFPTSVSNAFRYSGGAYQPADLLDAASGYWLKFSAVQVLTIDGAARTASVIQVTPGWNLIGSISSPVSVSAIRTSQPNLLTGNIFGYYGGYSIASSIEPGRGYWVKASAAGTITLGSGTNVAKALSVESQLMDYNSIVLKDARGNMQTLYFGSGSVEESAAELPPVAPEGSFDVRFGSQKFVETLPALLTTQRLLPIAVQSEAGALTVSWSVKNSAITYALSNGTQKLTLSGSGSAQITLQQNGQMTLSAQPSASPRVFALYQNYPNPFNPVTTVRYDLPAQSRLTLKVYNILGQLVATLVDEIQVAGYKEVGWNATSLSSGMYFYKLDATSMEDPGKSFTQVRKMLLVK